jgi:hypothetical protein
MKETASEGGRKISGEIAKFFHQCTLEEPSPSRGRWHLQSTAEQMTDEDAYVVQTNFLLSPLRDPSLRSRMTAEIASVLTFFSVIYYYIKIKTASEKKRFCFYLLYFDARDTLRCCFALFAVMHKSAAANAQATLTTERSTGTFITP